MLVLLFAVRSLGYVVAAVLVIAGAGASWATGTIVFFIVSIVLAVPSALLSLAGNSYPED